MNRGLYILRILVNLALVIVLSYNAYLLHQTVRVLRINTCMMSSEVLLDCVRKAW